MKENFFLVLIFLLVTSSFAGIHNSCADEIRMDDPVVIGQGKSVEENKWGFFQFPRLYYTKDKKIVCMIANKPDSIETYTGEYLFYISDDQGLSWKVYESIDQPPDLSIIMNNGCYFQGAEFRNAWYSGIETLSEPVFVSDKGNIRIYFAENVDESVFPRSFLCSEYDPETDEFRTFESTLIWPEMPVEINRGLTIPLERVFFHFRMHSSGAILKEDDGNLFMAVYAHGFDSETAKVVYGDHYNLYFFRSSDNARTWEYISELLTLPNYSPDNAEGFCEPNIIKTVSGAYFMLIRTGSGFPSYSAVSYDKGKTWEKIEKFSAYGVDPQLLQLKCGVTLATYGRPGLYLRWTDDPDCSVWNEEICFDERGTIDVSEYFTYSCSYTSMLPLNEKELLLAYSDFQYPDETDPLKLVKTILVRRVTVEK